jgi:thiamine-monophosphate kinase
VENVHFREITNPWSDIGWKVMTANVSDIASMGAQPICAFVTLGLRPNLAVKSIDLLYQGFLDSCRNYSFLLMGGDIVKAEQCFINVTMIGICDEQPMARTNARIGDSIAVTGPLGGSAAGLKLLSSESNLDVEIARRLVESHLRPIPRLSEGQTLLKSEIRCAMDISDGLIADLEKLCRASGAAGEIISTSVPQHPDLTSLVSADCALQLALNGGEEYELVFTGTPEKVKSLVDSMPGSAIIGRIVEGTPGRVSVLDKYGKLLNVSRQGWDHLR